MKGLSTSDLSFCLRLCVGVAVSMSIFLKADSDHPPSIDDPVCAPSACHPRETEIADHVSLLFSYYLSATCFNCLPGGLRELETRANLKLDYLFIHCVL